MTVEHLKLLKLLIDTMYDFNNLFCMVREWEYKYVDASKGMCKAQEMLGKEISDGNNYFLLLDACSVTSGINNDRIVAIYTNTDTGKNETGICRMFIDDTGRYPNASIIPLSHDYRFVNELTFDKVVECIEYIHSIKYILIDAMEKMRKIM